MTAKPNSNCLYIRASRAQKNNAKIQAWPAYLKWCVKLRFSCIFSQYIWEYQFNSLNSRLVSFSLYMFRKLIVHEYGILEKTFSNICHSDIITSYFSEFFKLYFKLNSPSYQICFWNCLLVLLPWTFCRINDYTVDVPTCLWQIGMLRMDRRLSWLLLGFLFSFIWM